MGWEGASTRQTPLTVDKRRLSYRIKLSRIIRYLKVHHRIGSRTCALRIMFRDLSPLWLRGMHQPTISTLTCVFKPLSIPIDLHLSTRRLLSSR